MTDLASEIDYIDGLYFAGKITTSEYNSLMTQALAHCPDGR